jgi:YfiH family protein
MREKYLFDNLSNQNLLVHLVSKKNHTKEYHFSLALHTDENPQRILKNRAIIQAEFPLMRFMVANQTHSSNIETIDNQESKGWNTQESVIKDCDALISNQKGVMLTILTADCVPILLFDPQQKAVGAVHAGWRGTEQEIVFKTVEKMVETFGSNPKDIIAGVAPSIGVCCYEVEEDVAKHFFDDGNAYTKKGDKFMLNLPHVNKMQLLRAGLSEENIEMSGICTACEVEDYFSYRKEQGCSGRFMSMIGLKNNN